MFHPVLVLFVIGGFSALALHYSKHPRLALASGSRDRSMEISLKTLSGRRDAADRIPGGIGDRAITLRSGEATLTAPTPEFRDRLTKT
jgi:hypothetical protein